MEIIEYIPKGKANAVSRNYLKTVTGMTDRHIRMAIQAFNESGEGIIACEAGKGYFVPETRSEAESYIRYSQSYLISLARKDRSMKRAVERMFSDQMELDL